MTPRAMFTVSRAVRVVLLGPFATLGCPICPRHPYLPKGAKGPGTDAQPSCRSPGFGEPRVLADQFQRNGVRSFFVESRYISSVGAAISVALISRSLSASAAFVEEPSCEL
jgi:hypothetical protein